MKELWLAFILGQLINAGHINYQQTHGYYEVNPLYGRHPKPEIVYAIKAGEILAIWGATRLWPEHEKGILIGANTIVWGVIIADNACGVKMGIRF